MSYARVHSRALQGIDALPVTIEAHLSGGLPSISIVGVPETAVRESKDRVRSALLNCGFEFPARRITVNLAPADLPKEGGRFDLGIAISILAASGQLPGADLEGLELLGELSLTGELRPVRGVLCAALAAGAAARQLVVPPENAPEALLAAAGPVLAPARLGELCAHLCGRETQPAQTAPAQPPVPAPLPDLADVRGQAQGKRALEIAAAGGHSLLLLGPPGAGKTLLASRLPGLLSPLDSEHALQVAALRSVSGLPFDPAQWRLRPFRAPHHTASAVALAGGGSVPRPGEISLAHGGVLFLDELPEFERRALEVLREPLETGHITIARAARQVVFPARFQLIAAMNPCPCGYLGDGSDRCRCTSEAVQRYRARLSGPLLDRIDMHLELPAVPARELLGAAPGAETSAVVRERVRAAQGRQAGRGTLNAQLDGAALERHCALAPECEQLMVRAIDRLGLSARGAHRIIRLARTIADLAAADDIAPPHIAEAIGLRVLDRRPRDRA